MRKKKDTKKECLREFIDGMNARLKKYDIAAKLPRGNGDIDFIFGKTWGSALKNRLAAYISPVYVTSLSYDIFSDEYKWKACYLPKTRFNVRTTGCFHLDGGKLAAYNTYSGTRGDVVAKYFAEFRKMAVACDRASTYLEKL